MMRLFFLITMLFWAVDGHAQAYLPFPSDSAVWRYRIYDNDYLVQVIDFILYLNGQDTTAFGNTYHVVETRQCRQTGPSGFNPPVVPIDATTGDYYYGAIRESGKQIFQLNTSGEQLIYDFNVSVGDSIPAYNTKDKVIAIDSVLLDDGVYHKRYLTTDSTYYVIEGVGSNRGLFPGLNDGGTDIAFFCLTHLPLIYSPDTGLTCTPVYPLGYSESAMQMNAPENDWTVYPIPATDFLLVTGPFVPAHASIIDVTGRLVWEGHTGNITVRSWPRSVYYLKINEFGTVKKIILQ